MDGRVFISRQSWHFHSNIRIMKVLYPNSTLTWRVNNYVSRQGKFKNKRNECNKGHS